MKERFRFFEVVSNATGTSEGAGQPHLLMEIFKLLDCIV